MAQFQVPQFIETEDKIVGPLTIRQFLYLAAAAAIAFLLFFFVELWLWLIFAAIFGFIAALFAFVKVNGRSFEKIILVAFKYYWGPRLYLWQRKKIEEKYRPEAQEKEEKKEEEEEKEKEKGRKEIKKPTPSKKIQPAEPALFGQILSGRGPAGQNKISALWQQLLTTRRKLKREKKRPERYLIIRKASGEKVAVKRVDYR